MSDLAGDDRPCLAVTGTIGWVGGLVVPAGDGRAVVVSHPDDPGQ